MRSRRATHFSNSGRRSRPSGARSSHSETASHGVAPQTRRLTGIANRRLLIPWTGLLAYVNAFKGSFIVDDAQSVVNNPTIRVLSDWRAVLTPFWELPTAGRPLVNLSLALNYALGGLNVTGYHMWNLASSCVRLARL